MMYVREYWVRMRNCGMPSPVAVSQNCRKIEFAFKWQRTHAKSLSSNYPTHALNILEDSLSYELSAEWELHCEGSPFTGERAGTILASTSMTAGLKEVDAARARSMLRKMTQLRPSPLKNSLSSAVSHSRKTKSEGKERLTRVRIQAIVQLLKGIWDIL